MLKTGTRFSFRDKRLFKMSEVEITRVDCMCTPFQQISTCPSLLGLRHKMSCNKRKLPYYITYKVSDQPGHLCCVIRLFWTLWVAKDPRICHADSKDPRLLCCTGWAESSLDACEIRSIFLCCSFVEAKQKCIDYIKKWPFEWSFFYIICTFLFGYNTFFVHV